MGLLRHFKKLWFKKFSCVAQATFQVAYCKHMIRIIVFYVRIWHLVIKTLKIPGLQEITFIFYLFVASYWVV